MGQLSVEIYTPPGSLLSGNQQPVDVINVMWPVISVIAPVLLAKFPVLSAYSSCSLQEQESDFESIKYLNFSYIISKNQRHHTLMAFFHEG